MGIEQRRKLAAIVASVLLTIIIPALVFGMIKVDPSWGWPLVGICVLASVTILIWGFSEHHLTDWRKKMWPLGFMIFGFVAYGIGAGWYFVVHYPKQQPDVVISSHELPRAVATPSQPLQPPPAVAAVPAWPANRKYADFTPEEFLRLFDDKSYEQMKALVALYQTDWIKVEGVMTSSPSGPYADGSIALSVSTDASRVGGLRVSNVNLSFDKRVAKKALALKSGAKIRAVGQVTIILGGRLFLSHSLIVSQER